VANAVILHNAYDMTEQLKQLIEESYPVTREDIATLSPYVTSTIKRFGDYVLNVDAEVPSLEGAWMWEGPLPSLCCANYRRLGATPSMDS